MIKTLEKTEIPDRAEASKMIEERLERDNRGTFEMLKIFENLEILEKEQKQRRYLRLWID